MKHIKKLASNVYFWIGMIYIGFYGVRAVLRVGETHEGGIYTTELPVVILLVLGGAFAFGFVAGYYQRDQGE